MFLIPYDVEILTDVHTVRSDGELNILLVGSGDPRHILKTLSGITESDVIHVRETARLYYT